jgi:Ca2+-binding EF-hand superfamily protein
MEANTTYKDKVLRIFKDEDKNRNYRLNSNEFRRFYMKVIPNTPLRLNDPIFVWDGALRLFDTNDDGEVTFEEAWNKIRIPDNKPITTDPVIVPNMTKDEFFNACRVLYNRADSNNDRKIDYSEFIRLYVKVHPNSQFSKGSES